MTGSLLLDDLDFEDILDIEEVTVPQFVCKMGKSSRNKRKQLENYQLIYSDMGPSMSTGTPFTQEKGKKAKAHGEPMLKPMAGHIGE
ncbi:hypothetical protein Tco_0167657 [Tanacetum coccineum]